MINRLCEPKKASIKREREDNIVYYLTSNEWKRIVFIQTTCSQCVVLPDCFFDDLWFGRPIAAYKGKIMSQN